MTPRQAGLRRIAVIGLATAIVAFGAAVGFGYHGSTTGEVIFLGVEVASSLVAAASAVAYSIESDNVRKQGISL